MSTFSKLAQNIALLSQKRATGEWLLHSSDTLWKLYFYQGGLLYATGGFHRCRRWQRALKQHCPDFVPEGASLDDEPWESQRLNLGVTQKQLSITQAKAVIRTTGQEVLFFLACHPVTSSRWSPSKQSHSEIFLSLPLSSADIEQILKKVEQLWQQWQNAGLANIFPEQAPVWKQPPQEKNWSLEKLLNGDNTLWDIAYQLKRPVTTVTLSLLPLIRRDAVELKEVPDLSLPLSKKSAATSKASSNVKKLQPASVKQPLIACIDDSPVIGQTLEKILIPAGYRLLKITEPLRQMSEIVKHKPDLIFLDLLMPDASGHSICTFLRKTPMFQNTPIIILTSRDSIVNRGQAKLTGASDFLSKPPEREKVLQIIHKYLSISKNS
ncbi:response regulator [Argonema galeatum]|uniref:response regulator n=1 Tax=Argonema galeatum TaxID=2942762 RepID=UPI002011CD33|nr:response regulator [Argonema galeatum]MCL1468635.1 response regulator [Argonema galeatum A003/A1]